MSLLRIASACAALCATLALLPASGDAAAGADYGVYCVRGRLLVEQKRIEELKAAHGEDVCRLEQDATEAGARDKAVRLGGIGAACECE